MAVRTQTDEADDADEFNQTLRDEEFMAELDEYADRSTFNPETGHLISVFTRNDDNRAEAPGHVFDLADRYAYDVVRVNSNEHSTKVVFG